MDAMTIDSWCQSVPLQGCPSSWQWPRKGDRQGRFLRWRTEAEVSLVRFLSGHKMRHDRCYLGEMHTGHVLLHKHILNDRNIKGQANSPLITHLMGDQLMFTSRKAREAELHKLSNTKEGKDKIRKLFEELTGERLCMVAVMSHLIQNILDYEFLLQTA